MNNFLEFLGICCAVTFGSMLLLVALFTPVHFLEKSGCGEYAETLGFEYTHTFTTGCVIKTESGWIKSKNYIINKEEK